MQLFIIAYTELGLPQSIVNAKVKDIIQNCAITQNVQIVVVGQGFSNEFISFCNDFEQVVIKNSNTITELKNPKAPASIIHFGATIKAPKSLPQYFIPLFNPNQIKGLSFLKRYFVKKRYQKWIQNANKVLCTNDWAYNSLKLNQPKFSALFTPICLPTVKVKSFEWQELSAAKEALTDGNNYFLAFAPLERLTTILKEFSIFKKWQQTTMHLVFIFDTQQEVEAALLLLKGYRFREAVSIHSADKVSLEWIAATYAILWEGVDFSKTVWMDYAIQYDIPILLDSQNEIPATWLKAGEVFSFSEKQALSNHFKLYYKDEVYRQARARMGKDWLTKLNEARTNLAVFNNIVLSHNK